MQEKNLLSIYEWLLFLIPFTLLIVTNSTLFPFITGKALTFRIIISITFVFAVYFLLHYQNLIQKKDILFWGLLAYFFALLIGTIFSIDPYRSFWGNAERMDGLWSLFFYLLYPVCLIILFRLNPESKKKLFFTFLIVSVLISSYAVFEKISDPNNRPEATLGNATYVGFFSVLMFFLTLIFFFQEKKPELKFIYILSMAFNLLGILFSETRGSILALLAGLFIFFFYLVINFPDKKKKIVFTSIFLASVLLFLVLLYTPFASQIPGIRRVANSLQDPNTYMARVVSWQIFLSAFQDKPIFGYGLETMPFVFAKHFNPKLFHYEEAVFDRPHNKYIEMLVSTGIVGFLLWLFFLISAFIWIIKSDYRFSVKAAFLGFFFAYLAQNLTLFDMQASYLTFFFGLALAAKGVNLVKKTNQLEKRPILFLIVFITFLFLIIHLQHLQAVRKIIIALKSDPKTSTQVFQSLKQKSNPFLSEAGLMAYTYINRVFSNNFFTSDSESLAKIVDFGQFAAQNDPYNIRLYTAYLSLETHILKGGIIAGIENQEKVSELKSKINQLLRTFPNFPDPWLIATQLYIVLDETQEAQKLIKEAITKFPYGGRTNFLIGNLAYSVGDIQSAKIAYERALDYHFRVDSEEFFLRMLEVFAQTHSTSSLQKLLEENQGFLTEPQTLQKVKNMLKQYSISISPDLTK